MIDHSAQQVKKNKNPFGPHYFLSRDTNRMAVTADFLMQSI